MNLDSELKDLLLDSDLEDLQDYHDCMEDEQQEAHNDIARQINQSGTVKGARIA